MSKFHILAWVSIALILAGCSPKTEPDVNPFFTDYNTPFDAPPFDRIDNEHYLPAFQEAVKQHKAEIEAIVADPAPPDFKNTIVAFDDSGALLRKVNPVYGGLRSAETNPRLQEIAREVTPLLTAHSNDISLNETLFQRIKTVFDARADLGLEVDQLRLVEKIYEDFERSGAALSPEDKEEYRRISDRMSMVSLQLGDNLLAETNNFKLVLDAEADLAGLPAEVIAAAAEEARKAGHDGKWVFTMAKPSWTPFLQFSPRRDLREKLYRGYFMRGDNDNEHDNKALFAELMQLRLEMSRLMGYKNYADFKLEVQMAENPENVYSFLNRIWAPALARAKSELAEMQAIAGREKAGYKLASWDWWYYAEKLRKEKYDLDEEELKPYFTLDNVRDGIFHVANRLYGLEFVKRPEVPVYHREVAAYEVIDNDGSHLAILYIDSHPRPGKRVGAWCGTYRSGAYENGKKIAPIVTIVTNFTRPSGDKPAVLSWDETTTFFHEFGHALHNFFADGRYRRTSRSVPSDFVELPSQIMENWAGEPEVLKAYAKHYETGEVIPDELISRLRNSGNFNQGFLNTEYIAAAILDMDWHTAEHGDAIDVNGFENASMNRIGLIKEIVPRYRTTYFSHIFGSGYAAGYYVYNWAGVLDADAFLAFKESGDLFNPELAAKFRKHIMADNGLGEGMSQYVKFRGKEPDIDAFLIQKGLK
ncbi:MAG: M3 family metallopeptidase [Acidobacteriota bacterium]|nr:M3 family metallopeptidase [Acidobacteriota bacterium]